MAWWIDGGGAVSAGIKRFREVSTAMRSSSKKVGRFIVEGIGYRGETLGWAPNGRSAFPGDVSRSRLVLAFGIERFGDKSAIGFLQEDFYAAFSFFELLLAFAGKRDAFFEQLHGLVERKLRALETADYFFEARERAFKIGLLGRFGFFGGR
jgi:hypothetical protein